MFANLLNNSAKYTDRGGHIRLTAERQGSDVLVSVKDSGIGIAADQLPRLFQMFSQVECSLEKAQGGLGIGLTLTPRPDSFSRFQRLSRSARPIGGHSSGGGVWSLLGEPCRVVPRTR